ncbi:MAG: spondin domain-containing protein, partial [Planctomycetales bacterium]|nr:spondin domain-containing protein [Planctomycetales bacterium]
MQCPPPRRPIWSSLHRFSNFRAFRIRWSLPLCVGLATFCNAGDAEAVDVRITIQNVGGEGGVALSPFSLAAHDGSFDAFDVGSVASQGVENVAETGDGAAWQAAASTAQADSVVGTAIATENGFGPGIFVPGASGSLTLS